MKTLDEMIDSRDNRDVVSFFNRLVFCIRNVYWWIRHSITNNYRVIKIRSLKPGYYDVDTRLFHGAFDLLVEFCEVELAHMEMFKVKVPWWKSRRAYQKAHAEELVMKYFDWAENYKDENDPTQGHPKAQYHKELRELYVWWKHTRPARLDPTKYWSANRKSDSQALQKSMAMDAAYEDEDTKQFIRLVNSRAAMWT